jgi:UDP-N-acetylglucosamine transferase subunit ALG13
MIFVTVGTHTQSFNRLLEEVDRLVGEGKIREKVVAQIGHSTYEPKNIEWFRFESFRKLNRLYKNSRIIITHGGAGSILNGLGNNKIVIAVPRLKKYNEHTDDHQIDLVRQLEKKGRVVAVYDIKKLKDAVMMAKKVKKMKTENTICEEIEKFLSNLQKVIE